MYKIKEILMPNNRKHNPCGFLQNNLIFNTTFSAPRLIFAVKTKTVVCLW